MDHQGLDRAHSVLRGKGSRVGSGHGYTWEDVVSSPVADLAEGDTAITPGWGTAFHTGANGKVLGLGGAALDGFAWTVLRREGNTITARTEDGREATRILPARGRVLKLKPEAKK